MASGYLMCFTLAVGAPLTHAAGIEVRRAETRVVNDVYLLDADVDFRFSDDALEALDNGVTLTVVMDMQVIRTRAMMWDERVARVVSRRELRVHPLSNNYILNNLNAGSVRTFRSLEAATSALGTLRNFPMLDAHLLQQDQSYSVRLRARLDIEALPAPLRPLAYLSSRWRLKSAWYTWPIRR